MTSNIATLKPRLPVYERRRDKLYQMVADRKVNIYLGRKESTVNHLSKLAIKGNKDENFLGPACVFVLGLSG